MPSTRQAWFVGLVTLGIVVAVTAHHTIPVLMGPGWDASIPVLQVLALVGAVQQVLVNGLTVLGVSAPQELS